MARFIVQRDGLFLGSSSAVNLVACVKLVRKMGWGTGEKVVTVLYVFPSLLPDLSHCPDANDAVNFSRDARVKLISRCDSGARHYSKVRLLFLPLGPGRRVCCSELIAKKNSKLNDSFGAFSSLRIFSLAIFAGPRIMTDQMKLSARITGMMHTSPRLESPSTWASFKICLRSRSRRCRRLLKYNSRILSLQSVCEAPRAKKHRRMMFRGLIGHNPPFNCLGP